MRELSKVLTDLIDIANHVVTRHGLTLGGNLVSDRFSALAAELRYIEQKPSEGVRCTNAALAMVIAIEAYRDSERDPLSPWLMIVGALLPILRTDAWRALNDEKEARG